MKLAEIYDSEGGINDASETRDVYCTSLSIIRN